MFEFGWTEVDMKRIISAIVELKNGHQLEVMLPAIRTVCFRCDGTGTHVNPNVDGNGLSQEDFDADPDFKESYFRGDYDVCCSECKGARVLDVVNYEALTPKMKVRYDRALNTKARDDQESAGETRWGA